MAQFLVDWNSGNEMHLILHPYFVSLAFMKMHLIKPDSVLYYILTSIILLVQK